MRIFLLEYLFFIANIFAIMVSISAASLFYITYKYERQLRVFWRGIGFCLMALSFMLLILEHKYAFFGPPAVLALMFGFYSIFRGVRAEPSLQHLLKQ